MWGKDETPGEVERISKKPYPWPRVDDFNPDHTPSNGAVIYEALGDGVIGVFQVKGLGVLVLRATTDYRDPAGKLKFNGLSTLTKGEIGYAEKL